jgi:glycine cleavage system aminomethyltransferase T
MMLFGAERELLGHTTSFLYSPVLQRHIGMARVRPDVATVGTPLRLEITVDHRTETVGAQVVRTPFFNPPRKTA